MSGVKQSLKRFGFPVILTRVLRDLPLSWQRNVRAYDREKRTTGVLQARRRQIDSYFSRPGPYRLQIGTGENPLPGWLNTDLEPMKPDILHLDALVDFPFPDQVFETIYSEHMIEHIPYLGGLKMLRECFRVMKPGGEIRIATPDVRQIAGLLARDLTAEQKYYIEWSVTHSLGLYSQEKSRLQSRRPEWDIDVEHILRQYPNMHRDPVAFIVNNFFRSYGHQFLYDDATLTGILCEAGFTNVRRFAPGESDNPTLAGIESHGHLIGDEINLYETMILQAARPVTGSSKPADYR